jgi:hypothetical protein
MRDQVEKIEELQRDRVRHKERTRDLCGEVFMSISESLCLVVGECELCGDAGNVEPNKNRIEDVESKR